MVFEAHGNLWKVSRNGGQAERLTAEPGYDLMPRYSPDGKWIAFTGQYQGNTDVYVIPADGRRGPAPHLPLGRGGRRAGTLGTGQHGAGLDAGLEDRWCSCRAAAP